GARRADGTRAARSRDQELGARGQQRRRVDAVDRRLGRGAAQPDDAQDQPGARRAIGGAVGAGHLVRRRQRRVRLPGPARRCDAVNRAETSTFAATWADDGVWYLGEQPIVGRDAIVAEWIERMDKYAWVLQSAPQTWFEVDERQGTGNGRVMVQERFKRRTGR